MSEILILILEYLSLISVHNTIFVKSGNKRKYIILKYSDFYHFRPLYECNFFCSFWCNFVPVSSVSSDSFMSSMSLFFLCLLCLLSLMCLVCHGL